MDSRLSKRRYRLGVRLFKATVLWARYWAIGAIILSFAITAVMARQRPDAEIGAWNITVSIFLWLPAVAAGMWLYSLLPVHISRGLTRREITVAFAVFGVLASTVAALIAIFGFLTQHALLELLAEPSGTWLGALGSGARYLLVAPIYVFGGIAVGALTLRIGQGSAAVAALLALAALIYAGVLVIEFFEITVDADAWTFAAWAGAGTAIVATLVAVYVLALRSIPVRAKRA